MSVRYEWLDAGHPFLTIQASVTGAGIGDDEVTAEGAISISGDEVLVIEGSVEQLRALAVRFADRVNAIEKWHAKHPKEETNDD